jgi:hypothetical protein
LRHVAERILERDGMTRGERPRGRRKRIGHALLDLLERRRRLARRAAAGRYGRRLQCAIGTRYRGIPSWGSTPRASGASRHTAGATRYAAGAGRLPSARDTRVAYGFSISAEIWVARTPGDRDGHEPKPMGPAFHHHARDGSTVRSLAPLR